MNFLQSSVETDRQTSPVGGRRVPQITSQAPCLDLQQDAREKPMLRARRVHNSPASLAVDAGSAVPTISRHGLQAPATRNDIRVRGRHCPHGPGLVEWAVQPMAPWRRAQYKKRFSGHTWKHQGTAVLNGEEDAVLGQGRPAGPVGTLRGDHRVGVCRQVPQSKRRRRRGMSVPSQP
ncbi:hypothetical protein Celaphus_00016849 [Cervus elaphus hippelaphus]|uniref:Uncharacterized protein n=1 Tax=Cervus elaphus hippelaphus TaxID=46360 RepID=A0A212C4M3_CEREH|nr:hypothetical protein Celaphus_00016849 [Cervus elaphus hippelaphus]